LEVGAEIFPHRFWGPPNLLPSEYVGLFSRGVKLTTPPPSNVEVKSVLMTWCLIRRRDNFAFLLLLLISSRSAGSGVYKEKLFFFKKS
jgi:hypothetical protein